MVRCLLSQSMVRAAPCVLLREGKRDMWLLLEGHCMLEVWLLMSEHLGRGLVAVD